jgi:hypothetical protein
MNKGSQAKAVESKPVEPKNAPAPTRGKVFFGYTPAGRKGKKA